MKMLSYPILLLLLISCNIIDKTGDVYFKDKRQTSGVSALGPDQLDLEQRLRLYQEKEKDWNKLIEQAREDYKKIEPIIKKKCYACHDSDTPEPFYGSFLNFVREHRNDGIDKLDFSTKFPFQAKGNPSQMALLKSFREEVITREMPLKIYTRFYPLRKIKNKDEEKILAFIDPLIEKIENFEQKFSFIILDNSLKGRATKILQEKCYRCHANGNNEGGFSNLENHEKLFNNSFYINRESAADSYFYTIMEDGLMPPSQNQKLTKEELETILSWMRESLSAIRQP